MQPNSSRTASTPGRMTLIPSTLVPTQGAVQGGSSGKELPPTRRTRGPARIGAISVKSDGSPIRRDASVLKTAAVSMRADAHLACESEDAYLTGTKRSLQRRILALNVDGSSKRMRTAPDKIA